MTATFLITFREGLEAAVIVGILLSTLRMLHAQKHSIFIWLGTILGIVMSLVLAWIFETFIGGFTGKAEKIYEGVLMLFAFGVITHMVFWIQKNARKIKSSLQNKVQEILERKELWALASLAFVAVVREGIETVIFLKAISVQSDGAVSIWAGLFGLVAAVVLASVIFMSSKRVSPKRFFQATTILLIFIAGGLLAHGIVELQGAQILPVFIKPLFDLSPVLSESEGIGSFLKALFGYDANPSLLAVVAYVGYLGTIGWVVRRKS